MTRFIRISLFTVLLAAVVIFGFRAYQPMQNQEGAVSIEPPASSVPSLVPSSTPALTEEPAKAGTALVPSPQVTKETAGVIPKALEATEATKGAEQTMPPDKAIKEDSDTQAETGSHGTEKIRSHP